MQIGQKNINKTTERKEWEAKAGKRNRLHHSAVVNTNKPAQYQNPKRILRTKPPLLIPRRHPGIPPHSIRQQQTTRVLFRLSLHPFFSLTTNCKISKGGLSSHGRSSPFSFLYSKAGNVPASFFHAQTKSGLAAWVDLAPRWSGEIFCSKAYRLQLIISDKDTEKINKTSGIKGAFFGPPSTTAIKELKQTTLCVKSKPVVLFFLFGGDLLLFRQLLITRKFFFPFLRTFSFCACK